jgi:ribosomal protein S18|uniref:30S ribosomal protein S18 n=2 Tax=Cyanidioschyzon merolae TaxID=45157 RepID=Q85FS0_CYAM1|nr:ribosomal protein S18 [Cyanidioschyzon merolae strain 10D]QFV17233.1 30S ribosomal protein S18 [Cyanidioschyzon merolae]BAC76275.1 30S ribosomal protein S18 [Cyanidioschyzon merolae strain 10D]
MKRERGERSMNIPKMMNRKKQRQMTKAIKRARIMALLPFVK